MCPAGFDGGPCKKYTALRPVLYESVCLFVGRGGGGGRNRRPPNLGHLLSLSFLAESASTFQHPAMRTCTRAQGFRVPLVLRFGQVSLFKNSNTHMHSNEGYTERPPGRRGNKTVTKHVIGFEFSTIALYFTNGDIIGR